MKNQKKQLEFVNVFEDSYPLYELCKSNGWLGDCTKSYDDFYNNGGELGFFEGDPDMIKIDGRTGYFCECQGKVYYYFDDFTGECLEMLQKFFGTYETGITLGGVGYAFGDNPDGVVDIYGGIKDCRKRYIWDVWDETEYGIAFRGGGGYSYWLTDWSEWVRMNEARQTA